MEAFVINTHLMATWKCNQKRGGARARVGSDAVGQSHNSYLSTNGIMETSRPTGLQTKAIMVMVL